MTGHQPPIPGLTPVDSTRRSDGQRYWLISGVAFALTGAVLMFALENSGAAVLGVELEALGGVLFAAGMLLIAAGGVQSLVSGASGLTGESVKSVGGLIAVVTGIVAVTALALVTTQTASLSKEAVVAITSSAFGIISTVIGAYLGIKITSEASDKTNDTIATAFKETQDR